MFLRLTSCVQMVVYLVAGAERGTGALLESERSFEDSKTGKRQNFPAAFSSAAGEVDLTVVVPAYKEETRLHLGIDEMIQFLTERERKDAKRTWEIVIVDDGSPDGTSKAALRYVAQEGTTKIRLLKLEKNRGKGGAVKRGVMVARGRKILMADADGATKFADVAQLEAQLASIEKDGTGVAVGSRAHLEDDDVVTKRSILRNILMWGFHFLVATVGGIRGIRDTQCGFKLFTRDSAHLLFSNMHIERWCFDVELLYLAAKFRHPVVEVAVNWQEIDGSKLDPLASSIQMLRDLCRIRACYTLGVWRASKRRQ